MSEKFVASNGVAIDARDRFNGGLGYQHGCAGGGLLVGSITKAQRDALREFFQHERDAELGRWRDPDSPYLVVYAPNEEGKVRVVDEHAGWGWEISPESKAYATSTLFDVVKAGHHYFEAHPEPKPWHDAKPGEVWAATVYGKNEAALTVMEYSEEGIVFMDHVEEAMFELTSEDVTNARRIFPEVASDDS